MGMGFFLNYRNAPFLSCKLKTSHTTLKTYFNNIIPNIVTRFNKVLCKIKPNFRKFSKRLQKSYFCFDLIL